MYSCSPRLRRKCYNAIILITKIYKIIPLVLLVLFIFVPSITSAHQPRIVDSTETIVQDPEVSKAYYGTLTGEADVYTINATTPFDLYVGVLVPDIAGQKKDVSAVVLKDGKQIAVLDGAIFSWKKFFEPFGHDTYWQGPEYKARAEAGNYQIRVWSSNNDSKYSLAVGEIEAFDMKEGLNAVKVIPELKKNFFNVSPIGFILSPFGWGLIVIMYILAFIIGFALKYLFKIFSHSKPITVSLSNPSSATRNIGKPDRLLRLAIGVGLLLWAITTTWSPILIFLSGFALFSAIFSLRPSASDDRVRTR
jgi:uncharacterized membrane protein